LFMLVLYSSFSSSDAQNKQYSYWTRLSWCFDGLCQSIFAVCCLKLSITPILKCFKFAAHCRSLYSTYVPVLSHSTFTSRPTLEVPKSVLVSYNRIKRRV
jgi:hypothetical protein